ncbi:MULTISPECIES: YwqG family protein [Streptomyces]
MTRNASATPLHDLARTHLPAEAAARWTGLLRPGATLEKAEAGEPVAGRLGGLPLLPQGVEWPVWEGHGPLSFVASVDCAALPAGELDIPLPADGTLAFFYFDGQIDSGDAFVDFADPECRPGARVIHIPAGVPVAERPLPLYECDHGEDGDDCEDCEQLEAYPEVPLTVRVEATAPDIWHPVVREAFGSDDSSLEGWPEEFTDALYDRKPGPGHQVGGHAHPVQNPLEYEIAHAALGQDVRWDDPRVAEDAGNWVLLAQFDTDGDADMMWGDCGALYWLIRPADLAALRFDRAMFTMQCC